MDVDQLHTALALTALDSQDTTHEASAWRAHLARFFRCASDNKQSARRFNPFYVMHEQTGDFEEYLRQVDVAWLSAQEKRQHAREVRYMLLHASVNSYAEHLPPQVFRVLVDRGIWSRPGARFLATNIPDPARRSLALLELADSNTALEDALNAADLVTAPQARTDTFIQLVGRLPHEFLERASRAALEAAAAIPVEDVQSERLSALARKLPAEWLPVVQAQAERITNEVSRSRALVGAAVQLASLGRLDEALALARNIAYDTARSEALGELAAYLPESMWRQGLQRARSLPAGKSRTSALIPYAACAARLGHLDEALTMARTMDSDLARAEALTLVNPYLTPELRQRALSIARECADALSRARALAGLMSEDADAEALAREALDENARVGVPEYRAAAIKALAPKLPATQLGTAASQARQLPDERARAEVLELLARRQARLGACAGALETIRNLPDEEVVARGLEQLVAIPELAESVVIQSLEVAVGLKTEAPRRSALGAIGARLGPRQLTRSLRLFRTFSDSDAREQARSALLPYLPAEFREKAFTAALALEDPELRGRTLEHLLPQLTGSHLRRAIATGAAIKNPEARASFNSACVKRLASLGQIVEAEKLLNETSGHPWREAAVALVPEMVRHRRVRAALDLLVVIQHPPTVVRALVPAAPSLPDQAVATVLAQIQHFDSEADEFRGEGLAALATRLAEPKRATIVEQALTAARRAYLNRERGIEPDEVHARSLTRVARQLRDQAVYAEALEAVKAIRDDATRARALERLIPVLGMNKGLLDQAAELLRTVRDPQYAATVWISLMRVEPRQEQWASDARRCIDSIRDAEARAAANANLAVAAIDLPPEELHNHFGDALRVLATRSRREALAHLATLAPVIPKLGGEAVVREVHAAIADVGAWWP